jgi:hypothetical protein
MSATETGLKIPATVADRMERGESDWEAASPIRCCFCDTPIPSPRNAWRKVIGFERQRQEGGTNALALRRPLDEYACNFCVDKQKAGVDPSQETLA